MTTCYISAEAIVNFVLITAAVVGIVLGSISHKSLEMRKKVKKS